MGLRLPQSLEVARKIARDGGIYPILVHPNILGHKLDFVRGFAKAMQGRAWFGSIDEFGSWWAVRDGVDLDAHRDGDTVVVRVASKRAMRDLTIEIPPHWSLEAPHGRSRAQAAPGRGHAREPVGHPDAQFPDAATDRERTGDHRQGEDWGLTAALAGGGGDAPRRCRDRRRAARTGSIPSTGRGGRGRPSGLRPRRRSPGRSRRRARRLPRRIA